MKDNFSPHSDDALMDDELAFSDVSLAEWGQCVVGIALIFMILDLGGLLLASTALSIILGAGAAVMSYFSKETESSAAISSANKTEEKL